MLKGNCNEKSTNGCQDSSMQLGPKQTPRVRRLSTFRGLPQTVFHLLCRECYLNQGPETPNAGANWTCKACAPFHFLYRHLYAIDQFNQHPESASYEYPFIAYPSYIEIWRLLSWLPKRSIQYITHNHHT